MNCTASSTLLISLLSCFELLHKICLISHRSTSRIASPDYHRTMSRPVSVEDLIQLRAQAEKPRFLSKKKREKLKESSVQEPSSSKPKRPKVHHVETTIETVKRPKPHGKFVFDWVDEEDTSVSYLPLVTLEAPSASDSLTRNTHWSEKPLSEMTPRDWRIFKDDYEITAKGADIVNPLRRWSEEELLPPRVRLILEDKLGYKEPTPIQRAAIPMALRSRDVVGIAETGSGKTLAFLLPILVYLLNIEDAYMTREHKLEANNNNALALVLAPTRELALQITKEAEKFTQTLGFSVVSVIGGHQYEETIHSLRNGVHIVVATPGRLVDSLERGIINLLKCYHLTLDEADKMIDMGFEKSLQSILLYLPTEQTLASTLDGRIFGIKKRASLMFTATISPAIEKITKNYLTLPGYLYVGSANSVVDNIEQKFEYFTTPVEDKQDVDKARLAKLIKLLEVHRREHEMSVIIFANFKRVVERLAEELSHKNFGKVATVHGSKSQDARELAIESFRSKDCSILVATDVAARGLDVPHVTLVVNFQMSTRFEEYIHRIGRTGRAGKQGQSSTYIDDDDSGVFPELKKFLSRGGYRIPDWLYRAT